MTNHDPEHGEAEVRYRRLLNPPRPAGRYRLLDRSSAPDRSLPAPRAETPVNRPYDHVYSKEGI
ncbi:hypothetical protein AB0N38_33365 [Micromonospora aurantiaca]|uniref:Uncharacterized protein n=1 Tax=Micromonospora aurantiaca (nom. illeg.) TaxID=47850 RepID=A0ABQ6UAE8_9ACTN|nr:MULTISPECIES: hypothetical protein [Micromonospora]KAB1107705.1 hypothetical protein F6X54_25605 [Micromonospora aurantiaca]MBC8989959.1 hypothetical protein [Micromonospora chalcea]MCT2278984.1 hypothetical protein [Micromonospora chalcea]MDG4752709.1 hypothetical protein [Micromonospora sp. WMMD718]OHX06998.1 hypothetical protein BFV98_30560 [Micromonospora sp. WMMB235]